MYGFRPFDGMGCAHKWIPAQGRDDSGEGILSITTIVETEQGASYKVYQVGYCHPGLDPGSTYGRSPYMTQVVWLLLCQKKGGMAKRFWGGYSPPSSAPSSFCSLSSRSLLSSCCFSIHSKYFLLFSKSFV